MTPNIQNRGSSIGRIGALAAAILLLFTLGAVHASVSSAAAKSPRVTIRTTEGGVPRILADGWRGLGFGYGFELAKQNICTVADSYLTVRGDRSRFLGPDETWMFSGNGMTYTNLQADFFFKRVIAEHHVEKLIRQKPPLGPKPQVKKIVAGYVQGYNRYLRKTGVENLPDRTCRGADWVRPITKLDVYRRFFELGVMASSGVSIDGIVGATPPGSQPLSAPLGPAKQPTPADFAEIEKTRPDIGSNAIALGRAATSTGKGMLLANPHFPWKGSERFFQSQLTVPGKINVSGASLYGVPLILIGHTAKMAWTHTVSTAFRFVPFAETLVPGDPTSYYVDGKPRKMSATKVTIRVKLPDGRVEPRTRTFYSTIHGPITTSLQGQPLFAWTSGRAYSLYDVNASNMRMINFFFDMNRAQSVGGVLRALKVNQGVPWVNTLAADAKGKALYADISVVPNVPDSKVADCNTGVGLVSYPQLGLPVLDGSRSSCDLQRAPGAVADGILPPDQLPYLVRNDYTENSNDSYWLANPKHPLEGFARIIGTERGWRGLRARNGLTQISERLNGTDGRKGNRFTLHQLQGTVFNDRVYRAELIRDPLVTYCQAHPVVEVSGGAPVDISEACPILASWSMRDDLDAPGAILFRQIAIRLSGSTYSKPFDPLDPVGTPSGLNGDDPGVGTALAGAVREMRESGIPLDATLRKYQYVTRNGKRIPLHGGDGESAGDFNVIGSTWEPGKGYTDVLGGTSFVMAASLNGTRCPAVKTILSYSQAATNARSRHFADQTRMYSKKQWLKDRFCRSAQLRAPGLKVTKIRGGARSAKRGY